MSVLEQIVCETQKLHQKFHRPHSSWVISQNVQNFVLVNNPITAWPAKIFANVKVKMYYKPAICTCVPVTLFSIAQHYI